MFTPYVFKLITWAQEVIQQKSISVSIAASLALRDGVAQR
jgi:hypothetical protein